jgi:UDP-N-acetyl-D-mannosaminuronate dehydrogenase
MSRAGTVVVVGLGEVGKPLFDLASERHKVVGVDISPPPEEVGPVSVMHVCIPYQIPDFVGETARYVGLFQPGLTIVNSTVAVGTTRRIAERTGTSVAYSPVRGKHAHMLDDLRKYTKFVGSTDPKAASSAVAHFESMGLASRALSSPEAAEVAKLSETTFFGLMIAWAQEVERYADRIGENYDEIASFYDEIGFFPPVKYFPGVIGGHCVMPNIKLLKQLDDSEILRAIESSNDRKIGRDAPIAQGRDGKG